MFEIGATLREARQRLPELRAVVLSMSTDSNEIDAAFQAGASAYVLKSAHPDDLASAVRQAFAPWTSARTLMTWAERPSSPQALFGDGEAIVREGEPGHSMFVVGSGPAFLATKPRPWPGRCW